MKSLLVIPGLVAAVLWSPAADAVSVTLLLPRSLSRCSLSAPWGLGRVYDQYVRYHTDAVADRPVAANFHKLVSTIVERYLPLLVAGVVTLLLLLALVMRRRRADPTELRRTVPRACC